MGSLVRSGFPAFFPRERTFRDSLKGLALLKEERRDTKIGNVNFFATLNVTIQFHNLDNTFFIQ